MIFQHINKKLRYDREIIVESLKNCPSAIEFVPNELKHDRQLINQIFFHHYGEEIRLIDLSDDVVWLRTYLKLFGFKSIPRTWSRKFSNNRELMMDYVKANGEYLVNVSNDLKNDKELVLEALNTSTFSLFYASDELKLDREIVLKAVKQDGNAYKYVAPNFSADKEIMTYAIEKNSQFFDIASDNLKSDYEFVLNLVSKCGKLLQSLPENLLHNRAINLAAVSNNGDAIQYSPFKNDPEFMLLATRNCFWALRYLNLSLFSDESVIEALCCGADISYFSNRANHLELLLKAAELNITKAAKIPIERLNEEMVLKFIRKDGSVIQYSNIKSFIQSDIDKYVQEAIISTGFFTKFTEELYQLRMNEEYYGAIMC